MSQYFLKPYEPFGGDINVKVDLSNYGRKTDLKNVSHVVVSSFAVKSNIASLKTEVDKIDADKLKTFPVDLAKLSNVVKNDVVKKTEYNKLVTNVNSIDTTNFVKKNKYEKDGSDFEDKISKIDKKIPDLSSLVKKTNFNSKITGVEGKIPIITGLATGSELTAVENKIPNISSLVKKTDFNTKVTEIEGKISDVSSLVKKKTDYATEIANIRNDYITNALFNARHKDLIQRTKFDTDVTKINDKIASNSSEVLIYNNRLNQSKDRIDDLERYASYFRGKNYFDGNDGAQNSLVFQVREKYFKDDFGSNSSSIRIRKSKG